ncbi:non-specific lipid-transfer protein 1-like [Henckelia pumila]|uniref:non-specific lipid-transfer protein 1-like n=1 Tax=Henckelia pumila TaxID=405737 RepID=UPI003C6DBFFE
MATYKAAAVCMVVVLVVALASAPRGDAVIGCDTVLSDLTPCLPYVTDQGPLGSCCRGIQALYKAAATTPDRQSVCKCLQTLLKVYPVNLDKAAALPTLCGISIPYKISPSTDCSTVK